MDKQKNKKTNICKGKRQPVLGNTKKPRNPVVSIGDKKLISVRYINKVPHINIRAYTRDEHGRMFSTKRGIMLTMDEWNTLKTQFSEIDNQHQSKSC